MLPATRLAATTTVNGDRPFRVCGFSLFLTTTHLISLPLKGTFLSGRGKTLRILRGTLTLPGYDV
jgi:hypothetical protein